MTLFKPIKLKPTRPGFWRYLISWGIPISGTALLLPLLIRSTPPESAKTDSTQEQSQHRYTPLPPSPAIKSQPPKAQKQSSHQSPSPPRKQVSPRHQTVTPTPLKAPGQPQEVPAVILRVAIATNIKAIPVGASTTATLLDDQGHVLGKLSPGQAQVAQAAGSEIRVGQWQAPAVWVKPTAGGAVYLGDHWYRGQVRLTLQGEQLLAVNYVDLEQYLYSVVGGEMPAYWPLEALKAQAIAARSYALVHMIRPADARYDLGATTRWQQYEGIQSETNTTQAAVDQTQGLLLSHQGGVVESMYAASDDIIAEGFGGQGMSQTGAYKLAALGYDYLHILGAYYPGTDLSWLQH